MFPFRNRCVLWLCIRACSCSPQPHRTTSNSGSARVANSFRYCCLPFYGPSTVLIVFHIFYAILFLPISMRTPSEHRILLNQHECELNFWKSQYYIPQHVLFRICPAITRLWIRWRLTRTVWWFPVVTTVLCASGTGDPASASRLVRVVFLFRYFFSVLSPFLFFCEIIYFDDIFFL